jgi:hypothetical protein
MRRSVPVPKRFRRIDHLAPLLRLSVFSSTASYMPRDYRLEESRFALVVAHELTQPRHDI